MFVCEGGNGKFAFINIHNNEVLYEKVYINGILQENGNVYRQSRWYIRQLGMDDVFLAENG